VDRLLTIPNVISVVRLCCVPWFVYLMFGVHQEYQAAWLLAILGATDWVDGYIARRFHQVSTFGQVFDPTADRLMLGVAAISLMITGAMPLWFGVIALSREVLVGVAGVALGLLGASRIDVQFVGKFGALLLMMSFPLFLVDHSGVFWHESAKVGAYVCGIPGLVLGWYSVKGYASRARVAYAGGRARANADRL
jgi:cardiolipin synthase